MAAAITKRAYRDAIVVESWEGAHNVLCQQILRDMERYGVHEPVFASDKLICQSGNTQCFTILLILRKLNYFRTKNVLIPPCHVVAIVRMPGIFLMIKPPKEN